mmetsp:Transcript_90758/g.256274  ORF Transcript_90758/g.256274 Transcript_90758/m.256274 type:complete len:296 (+) Transcript_90758:361-1248(+)
MTGSTACMGSSSRPNKTSWLKAQGTRTLGRHQTRAPPCPESWSQRWSVSAAKRRAPAVPPRGNLVSLWAAAQCLFGRQRVALSSHVTGGSAPSWHVSRSNSHATRLPISSPCQTRDNAPSTGATAPPDCAAAALPGEPGSACSSCCRRGRPPEKFSHWWRSSQSKPPSACASVPRNHDSKAKGSTPDQFPAETLCQSPCDVNSLPTSFLIEPAAWGSRNWRMTTIRPPRNASRAARSAAGAAHAAAPKSDGIPSLPKEPGVPRSGTVSPAVKSRWLNSAARCKLSELATFQGAAP